MPHDSLGSILRITIEVASCAVLVVAPFAIGLGWLLARKRFFGRSILETLVSLPLVLPATAIGYLLLSLLGRDGWFGERRLGFDPHVLFTWRAAVLASAVVALPLSTRVARAAFESVDPRLESMARSLGTSRMRTFTTVTLPLARRGLAAALVLGFGRALGEFGATVIVAGNIPGRTQTLSLAIFEGIQLGDEQRTLTLVGITCVVAFVVLFVVERLLRVESNASRP